jgi:hypothetical protein
VSSDTYTRHQTVKLVQHFVTKRKHYRMDNYSSCQESKTGRLINSPIVQDKLSTPMLRTIDLILVFCEVLRFLRVIKPIVIFFSDSDSPPRCRFIHGVHLKREPVCKVNSRNLYYT